MSDRHHSNGFLNGLILGALLGAGAFYFLTSTEEGKKIKKDLQEKGKDALENLADLIAEVEERGEEFKQRAKKIQAQLEEKAKSLQVRVAEEAQEQLAHIDSLRERGREVGGRFFTKGGKSLA
jgi:polyhydroxyalkanoate synthesis regulator phasin